MSSYPGRDNSGNYPLADKLCYISTALAIIAFPCMLFSPLLALIISLTAIVAGAEGLWRGKYKTVAIWSWMIGFIGAFISFGPALL